MENIHLAIIRQSLESFLCAHPAIQRTITADSVEAFFEKVQQAIRPPVIDILILDIGVPGMSGIEGNVVKLRDFMLLLYSSCASDIFL